MRTITGLLTIGSLALAAAACGGDDGGGAPTTAPSPGAIDLGDLDLDDLGELGDLDLGDLDLDDLQRLAESLDDLDLDDLRDLEGQFDDLLEGVDQMLSGLGGDGGGTITIDGVTYTVETDTCVAFGPDFWIDGPARGDDGSVAWVSIDRSISTRADMEDFMDEAMLDMIFPDGADAIEDVRFELRVGATSRFDYDDDQREWTAESSTGFDFGFGEIDYEVRDRGLRGRGQAIDNNTFDFDNLVPFEFDVACR